ncbi:unnamed protein product [Euphydryas editha]|nr:unnamed protein product [Euphydryas editha]
MTNNLSNDDDKVANHSSGIELIDKRILNPDVNSRDNWRNKEEKIINDLEESLDTDDDHRGISGKSSSASEKITNGNEKSNLESKSNKLLASTSKSYYFRKQPDISFVNDNLQIKSKIRLLKNGNKRNPLLLDGVYYELKNTCAFDSITQILAASAIDDVSYYNFIRVSSSNVMKFIQTFLTAKRMPLIYKERTKLLISVFESRIEPPVPPKNLLYPHVLDLYSSIADIWIKCFKNNPSGSKTYNCNACGSYSENMNTIIIKDQAVIYDNGYKFLTNYLKDCQMRCKALCPRCHEPCVAEKKYNQHLFVELEIRKAVNSPLLQSTLEEFESNHEFFIDKISYRLKGVVSYQPKHFIAYCRRANGRWELYNDTNEKVVHVTSLKTELVPSAAIFIRYDAEVEKKCRKRTDNDKTKITMPIVPFKKMRLRNRRSK